MPKQTKEIRPTWRGETAFLLGGGPSLPLDRLEELRKFHVIAINQARRVAPWAEVLYFGDCNWFEQNKATLHRFKQLRITLCIKVRNDPSFILLRCRSNKGLDSNPGWLASINSGYAAINLAYHFGVKRIVLMGYDMDASKAANWHKDYKVENLMIHKAVNAFHTLVAPLEEACVEVVNTSKESLLTMFPFSPLDKEINRAKKLL